MCSWRSPAVAGGAFLLVAGVGILVWALMDTVAGDRGGGPVAMAPPATATAPACPSTTLSPASDRSVPSFAYAAVDDSIWMASADGASKIRLVCAPTGARNAAWSPSGTYLAHAGDDGVLRTLNVETGQDVIVDGGTPGAVLSGSVYMQWASAGETLVYEKFDGADPRVPRGLWAVTPGGAPVALVQAPIVGGFALSPDGRRLIYQLRSDTTPTSVNSRSYQLFIVNTDGSGNHKLTDGLIYALSPWSPDSRLLAYWKDDHGGSSIIGDIHIMEIDSGREFSLGEFSNDEHPQWSPDLGRDVFHNLAIDGQAQTATPLFKRASVILGWSPDGTKVAYVEGPAFGGAPRSLVILDLARGNRTTLHTSTVVTAHAAGSGFGGVWSPNSRYYAFASIDAGSDTSSLNVADTTSGVANKIIDSFSFGGVSTWYSPDGSRLLVQERSVQSPSVWVANADGSGLTKIADGGAVENGGDWHAWRPPPPQ